MHIQTVKIMSESVFQVLLLLVSLNLQASGAAPGLSMPNCTKTCGEVTIPYPFGIGTGCFLDDWYEIVCQQAVPILKKIQLRVLNISLANFTSEGYGMIKVSLPVFYLNASCHGTNEQLRLEGSKFVFSQRWNVFTLVGCDTEAKVISRKSDGVVFTSTGCQSKCAENNTSIRRYSNCSGSDGCCQTTLPLNLQNYCVDFEGGQKGHEYAFPAERSWLSKLDGLYELRSNDSVPVVLQWGIRNDTNYSLTLRKSSNISLLVRNGYGGNPYIIGGCQDIDECKDPSTCPRIGSTCVNTPGGYYCVEGRKTANFILIGVGAGVGALLLCLCLWALYKYIKKRKEIKLKEKHFKRNGGLLLEGELSSSQDNVKKSKLFNSKDLEKATDNFNEDRILGQGGQGTIYKGMLTDGKIVAIKKSKVIDEGKVEQFINEIFILSQINHRNVVKLLGCCLETEVPLLVYEFIPNGTLYQYLHNPNEEFCVSWDTRLRIATEVAGALFYLHSAASIPIYHRDIKSTNILLDEKYRAKVADFGTSKSVSLDQTHVTTLVQGTFGYLDPEYFQSSQFTDKSDVYSFGVVLAELLTGQKPISSLREKEGRSLATYFIISMEHSRLFDIVDAQVLKEGKKEEIASVANLAKRCLHLNGRNRPTMKEVAMELEGIRKLQNPSGIQQNQEDHEATASYAATFPSSKSNIDMDVITFSDVQPLLPSGTW
ncbi:hypothetical protein BT93_L0439 [Corymbia citriodora subsp. variegata]|uniref:Protein kinase domain-containing protein n=1 Tax=Corymbia citriodora subsp. variegata TaxID=360336 RepID=A0A8T0CPQ4_CORYI|nr:hypothetical protein BT93_L0439 [Corymbia citriodora subsp. variegata]